MSDHAARLRAAKVLLDTEQCAAIGLAGTAGVCEDAADEIERLLAALRVAAQWVPTPEQAYTPDARRDAEIVQRALRLTSPQHGAP